jgi:hypothetical protein
MHAPIPASGVAQQPSPLEVVGQLGGLVQAVAASDAMAFLGVGRRVVALEVVQPARPYRLGESPVLDAVVADIAVDGHMVYVAMGTAGLAVIDASSPGAMVVTATLA